MNGWGGFSMPGLVSTLVTVPGGQGTGRVGPEPDVAGFALALGVEARSVGDLGRPDPSKLGLELSVLDLEKSLHAGVLCDDKLAPLPFSKDDEPHGHALHPARAQPLGDDAPKERRERVAIEPVKDSARLLGADQPLVDLPRVGQGLANRLGGDLVKNDTLDFCALLWTQQLQYVPGDALALPVLVGRQQEPLGVLGGRLELAHSTPLVTGHDVDRLVAGVQVHSEAGPLFLPDLLWNLVGLLGKVADVPVAGDDLVVLAQERADGAGLGGRLDDDEVLGHGGSAGAFYRFRGLSAAGPAEPRVHGGPFFL
jgi:hypothetical protein